MSENLEDVAKAIGLGRIDVFEGICCTSCKKTVNETYMKMFGKCPYCRSSGFAGIREYKNHITGRILYAESTDI
ncbi:hypothetical protein CUJ83_08230 [Methanocella sp. CWC-04]|uniref:Uncharacterized protein n=1 Tax=Methanooceanicella nereidis TaxID=2052831 RepID=A0AAP2RCV3_9EURY|nr:hypothetical protein [Methanocella sp. CWC-04]MCD1294983.1 hypothetical protein [Methanocella sp. CWC-04]